MRRVALLALLVVSSAPLARAQDDDFSFEILEPEVQSVDAARYDEAKAALFEERYAEALAAYEEILADEKAKKFYADAEYDVAKGLYRMGLYHSALLRFTDILEKGPKHEHFASSREWVFFIARRMKDQRRVAGVIAQYADAKDLPAEYASEVNYQLARYYFFLALEEMGPALATEPQEEETGSQDFDFTDDGAAPAEGEGEGFEFDLDDLGGGDDDGFTFDLGDVEEVEEKPKKKETKKRARPARTTPSHKVELPKSATESLRRALGHVDLVDPGFPLYAKARYLKGLIHFSLEEYEAAVDAFQEVVRMTNPRGGTVKNPKLREMAFFSLARIHYQFEQFRYAIFYYDRIDRDSEAWLDALFESSWAYFRLGEYEKALGNLITIQSPFFADEYYPESHILKAIAFYENCRYPEARTFLGEFKAQYGGVIEELDRILLENDTPEKAWQLLEKLEAQLQEGGGEGGAEAITRRVFRLVLSDKRLHVYRRSIEEVDAERERLAAVDPPFAGTPAHERLLKAVEKRRQELVTSAGRLISDKLRQEQAFLKDLASKLIRIQFEITKKEKEALEASLRNESVTVPLTDYHFTTATDDERVYWPFEGEYWRDELGTYEYTLTYGCRPPPADEG